MTTRRVSVPMLYGLNTPARWLHTLAATAEGDSAGLCCQQWQHGLIPRLRPAYIVTLRRANAQAK